MKLKKILAGLMAAVIAVTASVCGMSVSAGAVSQVREYSGIGFYLTYIPDIYLNEYYDEEFGDCPIGMTEIGKNEYVIVEEIEPTDIITVKACYDDGREYVLDIKLDSDPFYYISQSGACQEQSGISVQELIDRYNRDLHKWDYSKQYEGKNVTFNTLTKIWVPERQKYADEINGNGKFTWKITIEPGDKNSTDNSAAIDISDLKIGKLSNQTYTGKALKPSITIKDGNKKLVSGTDYTVTYKNNTKPGKATVTITGKGDYTGTKTLTFKIVPKKVTLTGKTSGTKEALSWKKSTGAAGYEIYYSTDGGKFRKLTTVKGTKYSAEMTAAGTYKFKVRPYVRINGKKVYGQWSNTVSCK